MKAYQLSPFKDESFEVAAHVQVWLVFEDSEIDSQVELIPDVFFM